MLFGSGIFVVSKRNLKQGFFGCSAIFTITINTPSTHQTSNQFTRFIIFPMRVTRFNSSFRTYSLLFNNRTCLELAPLSQMQYRNRYSFLNQKEYDKIAYPKVQGKLSRLKQLLFIGRFVMIEGMKELLVDMKTFAPIWAKNKKQEMVLEASEEAIYVKGLTTLNRIFKLLLVSILPMSGPLIILSLAVYPSSAPAQFLTENAYYQARIELLRKQLLAIDFYRTHKITVPPKFSEIKDLQDARRLSELLYGEYRDGTVGYSRATGKTIPYFISKSFSVWFCKYNLSGYFKRDFANRKNFAGLNINEKIAWKFSQVMKQHKNIDCGNVALPFDIIDLQKRLADTSTKQKVAT